MRNHRSVQFMAWFTLIIIVGGAASCNLVLPSNLDELALSPGAMVRLLANK